MRQKPLDLNPRGKNTKIKAARLYSNIFSPPSVYAIFGFVIAWYQLPFLRGSFHAVIFGLLTSLSPMIYILIQLKRGDLEDIHLSLPGQRTIPYLLSASGSFLAYLILRMIGSSTVFLNFIITIVLGLSVLAIINTRWMISAHTASITAVTVFAGFTFGFQTAMLLSPLIISTAYIRYYLRRHSLLELFSGILLGILVVSSAAIFGVFHG